jgi:hypothetical protein
MALAATPKLAISRRSSSQVKHVDGRQQLGTQIPLSIQD